MKITYQADHPITDAACKKETGKTLREWFTALDKKKLSGKRMQAIQWIYSEIGKKSQEIWWPSTIWVEYERAHKVVNRKDGRAEGYNICATKTIAASVDDLYQAFADPKQLKRWFGAKAKASCAEGGKWSDGDGNSGEYLRVRENRDLRFTWNSGEATAPTLVDVTFSDKGKGKAHVSLMHQRIQTRPEADGLRQAWGTAFDKLKALLEKSG